mgnify:CR=1 FL=1
MQLGISLFFLALFRRQLVEATDIFLGFEKFGKALGLFVYISVKTFLWSLLFVIPGIIAAMRYSQAFYILADDPTKGIKQCVEESKYMMNGNKSKFFCLTLSFVGWVILAAVISTLISELGAFLGMDGILLSIIVTIGNLTMIPVTVYMSSTYAGFYEILAGHLIKSTEPAPVNLPQSLPTDVTNR